MNNSNKHDSRQIMDTISNTEKSLVILGEKLVYLLSCFKKVLEGQRSEDAKEKLILILKDVDNIKTEMHNLIDKVYAEKSFPYLNQIAKDNNLKEIEMDKVKDMIEQHFQTYSKNKQFRIDKK